MCWDLDLHSINLVANFLAHISIPSKAFYILWKTRTRTVTMILPFEVRCFKQCYNPHGLTFLCLVLEQISPTMVLTSSKSDELFMDAVRDHSKLRYLYLYITVHIQLVEKQGGQFQVRPWKEFTPLRGLNRLRSLPLFTCAVSSDGEEMSDNASTNPAQPRSAYEFMRRRGKNIAADPSLTRWSASVRLGNFLLDETRTPFCVGSSLWLHMIGISLIHFFHCTVFNDWGIVGASSSCSSCDQRFRQCGGVGRCQWDRLHQAVRGQYLDCL